MKVWADSEQTVRVRWFRCAEGARALPWPHAFGSSQWDYSREPQARGETARGKWDAGANTVGYTGQQFCGTPDDWYLGGLINGPNWLVTNDDGYSECCGEVTFNPLLEAVAGLAAELRGFVPQKLVVQLSADIVYTPPGIDTRQVPEGGAVAGGVAEQEGEVLLVTAGGAVAGGAAAQVAGGPQVGAGGAVHGGAMVQLFAGPLLAAGGQVLGGAMPQTVRTPQAAAGGLVLGGSMVQSWRGPQVAAGGLILGGVMVQTHT
jgi:hypothetical protein